MAIQVYLCDDVPALRLVLRTVLELDGGVEIVGESGDGRTALEDLARLRPDVLVLDLSLPELDGLEVLEQLVSRSPQTPRRRLLRLSGGAARRGRPPARRPPVHREGNRHRAGRAVCARGRRGGGVSPVTSRRRLGALMDALARRLGNADATERRRAEEELRRSEARLAEAQRIAARRQLGVGRAQQPRHLVGRAASDLRPRARKPRPELRGLPRPRAPGRPRPRRQDRAQLVRDARAVRRSATGRCGRTRASASSTRTATSSPRTAGSCGWRARRTTSPSGSRSRSGSPSRPSCAAAPSS